MFDWFESPWIIPSPLDNCKNSKVFIIEEKYMKPKILFLSNHERYIELFSQKETPKSFPHCQTGAGYIVHLKVFRSQRIGWLAIFFRTFSYHTRTLLMLATLILASTLIGGHQNSQIQIICWKNSRKSRTNWPNLILANSSIKSKLQLNDQNCGCFWDESCLVRHSWRPIYSKCESGLLPSLLLSQSLSSSLGLTPLWWQKGIKGIL